MECTVGEGVFGQLGLRTSVSRLVGAVGGTPYRWTQHDTLGRLTVKWPLAARWWPEDKKCWKNLGSLMRCHSWARRFSMSPDPWSFLQSTCSLFHRFTPKSSNLPELRCRMWNAGCFHLRETGLKQAKRANGLIDRMLHCQLKLGWRKWCRTLERQATLALL